MGIEGFQDSDREALEFVEFHDLSQIENRCSTVAIRIDLCLQKRKERTLDQSKG